MRVLITGAASGLGRAAAEYFAENSAYVYALDLQPIAPRERLHPLSLIHI